MRKTLLALACVCAFSLPILAATLADVTLPDTVTVGNQTLVLNGMGLRTKLFIKVYVGGLYLEKKSTPFSANRWTARSTKLLTTAHCPAASKS